MIDSKENLTCFAAVPVDFLTGNALQPAALSYLEHTVNRKAIRVIARKNGQHASTVLRQIRRIENKRDDPLVDEALTILGRELKPETLTKPGRSTMNMHTANQMNPDNAETLREARRILRRLCETGAFIAVSKKLPKAVVLRKNTTGSQVRTAVFDRTHARNFALQDWISCSANGKVDRYEITNAGRAALKRLLAQEQIKRDKSKGLADHSSPFSEQHKDWAERHVSVDSDVGVKRVRYNLAESPLTGLARKKDKDGKAFLQPDLLQAGERLREDFELAQLGPRVAQNWDRFLTIGTTTGRQSNVGEGPSMARNRVATALKALGPGLGDIVLRCCCFLEGLEASEKRMGWSARSGKIVLRIALQRLSLHYQGMCQGKNAALRETIG